MQNSYLQINSFLHQTPERTRKQVHHTGKVQVEGGGVHTVRGRGNEGQVETIRGCGSQSDGWETFSGNSNLKRLCCAFIQVHPLICCQKKSFTSLSFITHITDCFHTASSSGSCWSLYINVQNGHQRYKTGFKAQNTNTAAAR